MWLLGAVVLLGLGVRAWAAPATLERIAVQGERGAVTLHLSTPVEARAATLGPAGEAPDRIYVDLPGVILGRATPVVVPGSGNVLRIRSGQFDKETTRVVLDLRHAEPFAVRVNGSTITIQVGPAHLAPPRTFAGDQPPPDAADRTAAAEERESAASPTAEPPPAEIEGPPPPPAGPPRSAAPPAKPPAVASAPRKPTFPLPVIVLDAGHGGRDPGAEGIGGVREKDVALLVTQRLAARLPTRVPAIVVLTRADDSFVSIERRLAVPTDHASAFVSLHANASSDPSLHGVEVFYGGGSGLRTVDTMGASPQSASLGRCLSEALRPRVELLRRPRPGDFGVLVRNRVPSALVEIGYLTHPEEGARAQDPVYHDLLADALADGIAAFLHASAARL